MSNRDEWGPENDLPPPSSCVLPVNDRHYRNHKGLEVWDVVDQLGLSFLGGNVLKYLVRHKRKNGKADLLKGLDYLLKELCQYGVSREEIEAVLNRHLSDGSSD